MIALLWPGFWILLVPIVVLEAAVAKRVLPVSWKAAFRLSGEANLVSTLVGIPLTWLCLFLVEIVVGIAIWGGLEATGVTDLPAWLRYVLMPFMAPYFPLRNELGQWTLDAAVMWLLAVSFFTTVWIEVRVVTRRTSLPQVDVKRWSWQANALSYAAMEVLMLGLLGWTVFVK
jgi:hypothetical protein